MAYRGDATDPLGVIIQQRRVTNRFILWLLLGWVVSPMAFNIGTCQLLAPARPPRIQPPPSTAPAVSGAPAMVTTDGKMTSFALERWLSTAPSSGQAPLDVRCRRALSGWDYICSYAIPGSPPTRLKVGVRVSANSVVQASPPYKYEDALPSPSPAQ